MTDTINKNTDIQENIHNDGTKGSPKLIEGLTNFIIDIDGVISEDIPNEEPERMSTAFEIQGSKKQIIKWYKEGHIITYFTSRTDKEKDVTIKWLNDHGFPYHNVLFNKPRGGNYHYIDDKNITSTRFNGSLPIITDKKRQKTD